MQTLRRGSQGDGVEDLQLRLAGFRGTIWDGDFGPGTELQVMTFQKDYMGDVDPDGIVGPKTWDALMQFAAEYSLSFESLRCRCGQCEGFGEGRYLREYRKGRAQLEAFHKYEYPGIHSAILHTYKAVQFYLEREGFAASIITSGYRCWTDNERKGRKSTNHMGKAIDFDWPLKPGEDKRDDMQRCEQVRSLLVKKCGFQIGWGSSNRKALEPNSIAPTWIHADVRCYSPRYLQQKYFVISDDQLQLVLFDDLLAA